ncbi:MAG: NAD(P)H-dependent oxidoreductase [Eggerthellaceae bacterium]|jgi:NAD(P)H dehydrogenase (quinone)
MDKTLIIFDHPYGAQACNNEPHNRSFSAALCRRIIETEYERGADIDLIDLAADGFDPVMDKDDFANWRKGIPMNTQVADYQCRMREADRIAFVFPIWWELMPARTKGFLDKVYAKNVLYTQSPDGRSMQTRLKPSVEVFAVTTMGTPKLLYRVLFGKPAVKALQWGLCRKTGIKSFRWHSFSGVDKMSFEQRQDLLRNFRL